jgi:uncharacterized membrane protein YdjX (TVP38/TMEM64 family)
MTRPNRALRWALLGLALAAAILVPFVLWEEALLAETRRLLASEERRALLGALGALFLAVDLALPVPSSFVSAAIVAALGAVPGALVIWLGMTAGAFAGYALGRSGGAPAVRRFVGDDELARAERLMARYGALVLVVCRGVPVLAEASVLAAGAAKLRFATFALVTLSANLGLASAYALLSRFGSGGAAAVVTPFVLGIAVPGAAILAARRLERRTERPDDSS